MRTTQRGPAESEPTTPMELAASIVERSIRWLSIVLIAAISTSVLRREADGGFWALCVQILVIATLIVTAFVGRRMPASARMCIYCGSCLAYGVIALIRWGLLGQGLPIVILAVTFAAVFGFRRWLLLAFVAQLAFLAIAVGYVAGWIPIDFDPSMFLRSPTAWATAMLTIIASGLAVLMWERMFVELLRKSRLLDENEKRLRVVLDGAELGTWDWDVRTGAVTYDQRWASMLGYSLEEVEPHLQFWERLVHPDDLANVREAVDAHVREETPSYEATHRMLCKSGDWIWVLDKGRVIERDAHGAPLRMCGTLLDVTSHRETLDALRTSAQNHREIFNATNDAMFIHDASGAIVDVNERMCDLYGCSREEALSASVGDLSGGEPPYALADGLEWLRKATEEGPQRFEWLARRKDSTLFWVEVALRATCIGGEDRIIAAVHDISDRKTSEQEIRHEKQFSETLLESLPGVFYLFGADMKMRRWNRSVERLLGFSPEELRALAPHQLFPLDQENVENAFKVVREQGETQIEARLQRKNGTLLPFRLTGRRLNTPEGPMLLGVGIDISDRIQAEEAVRVSEARFRAYFEHSLIAMAVTGPEKEWVLVNDRLCELLGYSRDELMRMTWDQVTHPKDLERDVRKFDQMLMGAIDGYSLEKRFIRKDGTTVDTILSVRLIRQADGSPDYCLAQLHDITDRKKAEDALRQSEQRFRTVLESLENVAVQACEPDGRITFWNKASERLYGVPIGEVLGKSLLSVLYDAETLAEERRIMDEALRTGVLPPAHEIDMTRKDGAKVTILANTVLHARSGDRPEFFCFGVDISEIKRSQLALCERQEMINAIVETSRDWIWAMDVRGVHTYSNPAVELILGYRPEEVIGLGLELIHDDDKNLLEARWPEWTRERCGWANLLLRWRCKNGEYRYLESCAVPILATDGHLLGFRGVDRDVTERKLHDEDLRRKTEEVERFTYTVSHDLRSPLVTITAFLAYLRKHIETGDAERVHRDIEYILNATDKMGKLLDELLEMSRIGRMVNPPEDVVLQDLVDEVLQLVAGRIAQRGVEVALAMPNPYVVQGDRRRLLEVLQNLIDNAVKFMGDQAAPMVEIGIEDREGIPTVYVRDNGMGVDPRHQHKLFCMFERLHPEVEGVGMGLAMAKRIVETHGGTIWAESNKTGKGMTFFFTLAGLKPGSVVRRSQKLCRPEPA